MKTYTAEVYSTEKYQLGESPFYDSRTKTLSWVDIPKGRLFTQGPDGVKKSFTFDKPIGAAQSGHSFYHDFRSGTDRRT